MVFAVVLLVLLGISLFGNFTQLISGFTTGGGKIIRTVGPKFDEVLLEDNDAPNKIAVVDIEGIITGSQMGQGGYNLPDVIRAELKNAQEDHKIKAVILRVNSPGGEVLASDEISRVIVDFQKESKKPVIASMGSLAASGGYYVSVPCRWIVANELTITGSIGVIMYALNYRGLMDKVGLQPQVYKSGKFKDMLSGSRSTNEISNEERAMLQGLINEVYGKFKNVVAEGRDASYKSSLMQGRALSADWQQYADGRVLSGTEAYKLGFVDELGNFQDAVKRAKQIAGITSADLIQYQMRYDLSDFFHLFGKSETPAIKVDLGIEMPKIEAGKLYYLFVP